MKVYVETLPSCCEDCVCHSGVSGRCKILHRTTFDIPPRDCPLELLSDYTKQVRKEVVEFIDKCFEMQKYQSMWINPDKTEFCCDVGYAYEWWESFRKILLDQIQGKLNGKE